MATERVDEATEFLCKAIVPVRVTRVSKPQSFRLDMNGLRLGRLFFGYNRFSTDTIVEPGAMEGRVVIGLGDAGKQPICVEVDDERVRMSKEFGLALSTADYVRNWRPSRAGTFALSMSDSVLRERLQEVAGISHRGPFSFVPRIDLRQGPGKLLRSLFQTLLADLENEAPSSNNILLRNMIEDALISIVLGLPGNHSAGLRHAPVEDVAPWAVRRAEEYMVAQVADPVTLSDLVSVCGCSRSALYHAFKSSRGYTPMQFLMARRLELAHERLRQEPCATATEIALACGFSNQGRFAKAYREQFGELPSETHARSHGPRRSGP
ncbi:AraC family transcriptional regulator [Ruegeria sp. SCP11]|uniref:AraC family transcriptional regulator n=1 Tax=Ruegeria sp. SCP11 TaxID=3141378 RepID=UPI00333B6305